MLTLTYIASAADGVHTIGNETIECADYSGIYTIPLNSTLAFFRGRVTIISRALCKTVPVRQVNVGLLCRELPPLALPRAQSG
jgi:hypothetical protein